MDPQDTINVLFADDCLCTRTMAELYFKSIPGTEAQIVEDGQEAIALLKDSEISYDLVLTDLRMPKVGGEEVVRTSKDKNPLTPVYVITANNPEIESKRLEKELGDLKPDDVLQKPISLDKLSEIIISYKQSLYH